MFASFIILILLKKNAYSILHMGSAILIASKEGPNIQLLMKDKVENSFFNRTGLCYSSGLFTYIYLFKTYLHLLY